MKKLLIILLLFSLVAKLLLLGKGYLSNPDEYRHMASQDAFEYLKKGDIKNAVSQMFAVQGRPGLTLVGIIPAAFQNVIANYLKVGYNGIEAAWVIYIYNFIVFLFILVLIYKLCRNYGLSSELALFSVLLYSLSINGYLYLRHVFPFDASLLLLLSGLLFFKIKETQWNNLSGAVFGFIIAFAFVVYPGYYPLAFAISLYYGLKLISRKNVRLLIIQGSFTLVGGLILLGIFEFLAQYCGTSYLLDAKQLSGTITQGSFEESFSYIIKYLWQAEFYLGILYLLSLSFAAFYFILNCRNILNSNFTLLMLCIFCGFFIYASLGQFFHKMVFYGRLVHQFYPFLAILFGFSIHKLSEKSDLFNRRYFRMTLACLVCVLSAPLHLAFARVHYPTEILNGLGKYKKEYKINSICERTSHIDNSTSFISDADSSVKPVMYLINCCYPTGPEIPGDFVQYLPEKNLKLVFSYSHFINLTAYQFEGGNIEQRKAYRLNPLYIKAYK